MQVFFRPGKQDFLEKLLDEVQICSRFVMIVRVNGVVCAGRRVGHGNDQANQTIFAQQKIFPCTRSHQVSPVPVVLWSHFVLCRVHVRFAIRLRRMRALRLIIRVVFSLCIRHLDLHAAS